jgi:hypothetical protein
MSRELLADLVLAAHFGFVLFVVAGLALIVIGGALEWGWVRNRPLRLAHLGAIVFVALESAAGMACPLTVLEDALRSSAGEPGFVARWLSRVLYYDFPAWGFSAAYAAFAVLVALAWRLVPPAPPAVSSGEPREYRNGHA